MSNEGNNTIEKFTSSGVGTLFAAGLNDPRGLALAFNTTGNLYAANYGNNTIEVFTSSGGVLSSNGTVFASTGLDDPTGLAIDNAGNLYVANEGNNTIEKFNSLGVGTVFASSGLSTPQCIAIQPVPEPATWAMLAMGSVALFGGLRLRRRSS